MTKTVIATASTASSGPMSSIRDIRTGRYDGIDNNAYTNVMAVWVILRAIEALELMPLPNRLDLRERLGLTDEELAQWDHVSRRMFVPFHDGVISQFEGYENWPNWIGMPTGVGTATFSAWIASWRPRTTTSTGTGPPSRPTR